MDELVKTVGEHLGTVAGYVVLGVFTVIAHQVKAWCERRRSRNAVHKAVSTNVLVQEILSELRREFDCDRVTISQFHNGDYFASGTSVQKVTLTHYTVRPGVTHPADPDSARDLRFTPASFMPHLLDELFKVGYRLCLDFDSEDVWVQKYQATNGLRTVLLVLIPGRRPQEALGIQAFCWLDLCQPSAETIEAAVAATRRLSIYL